MDLPRDAAAAAPPATLEARALVVVLLVAAVVGCASPSSLREEDFDRVSVGMGQDDVRRLLGEPPSTEAFARQQQVAWTYQFTDRWGYYSYLSVIYDKEGRVVGKTLTRKEPQDN